MRSQKSAKRQLSSDKTARRPEGSTLKSTVLKDLARSGLDTADFKKMGIVTLSGDEMQTRLRSSERAYARAGYLIPYFNMQGKKTAFFRTRFTEIAKSKFAGKAGKSRYHQPRDTLPHVYFPPTLNHGMTWERIVKDPSVKIVITEGEKKAAAACKHGLACIALGGVWAWKSKKKRIDLLADLRAINWDGREVEICFDADVSLKDQVHDARAAFKQKLAREFSPKSIATVEIDAEGPAGEKSGLDDLLKERGLKGFESLERVVDESVNFIDRLNERICFLTTHGRFYSIEHGVMYGSSFQLRDAYRNFEKVPSDDGKLVSAVDLWLDDKRRNTKKGLVYAPGKPEVVDENINTWKPSKLKPINKTPKLWLKLVNHIIGGDSEEPRHPEYVDWFMQWLAYPVQNPGTKLLQAVFVHSEQTGTGKSFVVDTVMKKIYGDHNFYFLPAGRFDKAFNGIEGSVQMIVMNEFYQPSYRDRKEQGSSLRDRITRPTVTVNRKFMPEYETLDFCNYYFTSNHDDALVIEPADRRFFIIKGPSRRLPRSFYDELDDAVKKGTEANKVLDYLLKYPITDFNPNGEALRTEYRDNIISASFDEFQEFCSILFKEPEKLGGGRHTFTAGEHGDLQLFTWQEVRALYQYHYPKAFVPGKHRIGTVMKSMKFKVRKVRRKKDSQEHTLYVVYEKEFWHDKPNYLLAEHYEGNSKLFERTT